MINFVIPMAGAGSRFSKAGYKKPKPFIDILGKPMIMRVLENLSMHDARFILVARKEHCLAEKDICRKIESLYNVSFIMIDRLTEGAACTALYANRFINNEEPLVIANSDQIVNIDISDFIVDSDRRNLDGSVLCFEDEDSKWSYAKIDESGLIVEIKEKEVISKNATVGIYYFKKGTDFCSGAIDMFVRNDRVNNEFYVAPVYNYAIKNGGKYGIYKIDKTAMYGTGTPSDLEMYINMIRTKNESVSAC
ncbi:glycosyltransferase family 2 protein [Oxalobacter aliiformigenes]|uniref:Glycosyltransferase family 2 protein n=1 Tax=Oxalobacter aliiformigenes TaxID=2946593 RepID=A0A9E9LNW6_9BURK|nr:glycosyltransferase family 2 protein [Oxalobacter aliiformigenes]WAV90758.1 glycosyltransferase family 2 protein [Oxalobacter aliiformigenes]WAV92796.1 glycosyltransferase family 2 protein [Oxalobacter aliiformigenes]WAV95699.1 glycosyltransferase family 2 protein [Oxalobacter aliiformigenes]WAV96506.1 glycosyltransferase family 2 protein [Oxalobacter aliiformigenes]